MLNQHQQAQLHIGDKCYGSTGGSNPPGAGSTPASPALGLDNRGNLVHDGLNKYQD